MDADNGAGHHSFMNGLHIGLFAEKLQAYLDEC